MEPSALSEDDALDDVIDDDDEKLDRLLSKMLLLSSLLLRMMGTSMRRAWCSKCPADRSASTARPTS